MTCPECDSPTIAVFVPEEYRGYAPDDATVVDCCRTCLSLQPASASATAPEDPEFDRISDALPSRPDRAVPLVLAIDLLASLATNRAAIESLLREVERAGADPLLAIDRLLEDPGVDPAVDLERRRHQLEQFLY